jgi:uncharacterized Tic20 family protein
MSDTPSQQPPVAEYASGTTASKDERMWAMLCHVVAFAGFLIPFGNIIGPLVIWLLKKEEMPLVNDQGKESINFQITITIGYIISAVLFLVVIGLFLLLALMVCNIIFIIIAAIKANAGVAYRYPWALRLIK